MGSTPGQLLTGVLTLYGHPPDQTLRLGRQRESERPQLRKGRPLLAYVALIVLSTILSKSALHSPIPQISPTTYFSTLTLRWLECLYNTLGKILDKSRVESEPLGTFTHIR